jgi:hypothetical protein
MDENLTSYCGLCCSDCIPSHAEFFSLVDSFDEMLKDIQFEHYAELKSEVTEEFRRYPEFLSVLHHIRGLRCSRPCRLGGGNPQSGYDNAQKTKVFPAAGSARHTRDHGPGIY